MLSETGFVRVMFTVSCGALSDNGCPDEDQLARYRILSDESDDPEMMAEIEQARKELVAELRERSIMDIEPDLIDIGHYRMVTRNRVGRDVFVGLARVPDQLFMRNDETKLLGLTGEASFYFGTLFSRIFADLEKPAVGDDGFCWLTWVVVPLAEAFDGRFNPLGMGGIGHC